MVGNIPNYSQIDILRCFLRLSKIKGRHELAKELELGEGTIRTILKTLKSKKLLESDKKGHFLSKKGHEQLATIAAHTSMPVNLNLKNLYPTEKKIGVLIREDNSLKELYRLRDIAVKNGADGALIFKYQDKLNIPGSEYKQDYKELEKYFKFENNDTLVVAFSNKNKFAEKGALAIAIELSSFLKKFITEIQ